MPGKTDTELHERRVARFRAGATAKEIAAEAGVAVTSVYQSLKIAGVRPARGNRARRAYRLRAHGLTWTRIARDMDLSNASAVISLTRRWALNHGLPWPETSLDALVQWETANGLRNNGESV